MTSSVKTVRVVAAVIERDGRYLITQRRKSVVLPLLWEFPGGRVESGETDSDALRREVVRSDAIASLLGPTASAERFARRCATVGWLGYTLAMAGVVR